MRCSICKKERSTIHITQFKDGHYIFIDTCENCAVKEGLVPQLNVTRMIEEAIEKLMGSAESSVIEAASDKIDLDLPSRLPITDDEPDPCPSCGFRPSELEIDGKFGCASDYKLFETEAIELLDAIHRSSRYEGSAKGFATEKSELRNRLRKLKIRINQAISTENFEEAASLRDEISDMEKKLGETS